ncbi:hypothetical protein N657DRAFT_653067 [Parathielavia appendiculata]|uniref:GLEYA adhesin domain-containing protein n=1 Tax=Parathielavia appendiculata TaxID=2587402 RepID=A0AAN6UDU6_9PEZI|nr:hypothetical protein N657DRAFT_653067 [Parathielavia appendiculata]
MKIISLTLGLAGLHLAAAACCRSNQCLRAILNAANGIKECSSLLTVTVTPDTVTFTKTGDVPTAYETLVDTHAVTVTETTTASIETVVVVVSSDVTASTETQLQLVTQTVVTTQTHTQTVQVTGATIIPWRRQAASAELSPAVPTTLPQCPSWDKYVSACKCAGVVPTTVTADAPSMTVTVDAATYTASVLSTVTTTETVFDTVTATLSTTEMDIQSITATALTTSTVVVDETVTISVTQTQTTTAQAGLITQNVAAFRAVATDYNAYPLYIYANQLNGLTGGISWNALSTNTQSSTQNKYIFTIDGGGRLLLAYNIPPFTYTYAVYVNTATTGSQWPQFGVLSNLQTQKANGAPIDWVYGAVDPLTNRLYLKAAGRKNILWCGVQLWMSTGAGEDINRGGCTVMHPTIAPVVV